MFRSLMNVPPSHLADPELFNFAGLRRAGAVMRTESEQFDAIIPKLTGLD